MNESGAKIEAYCQENLLHSHWPDEYIFIDRFPVTRSGKVNYWEEHLENYIARQEVYEREEESHAHYMDKNDIEQLQAFEFLDHLIPSKDNAFMFRK